MPPVIAAGAALIGGAVAKGFVAATAMSVFSKVVIVGAISGAIGGAASAAMSGGNILKGALGGALIGGVTAGLANKLAGVTMGMEAAAGVEKAAGETVAGAMVRPPAETALLNEAVQNGWMDASQTVYGSVGESVLASGLKNSVMNGPATGGGGLTKGIGAFWKDLGSEGKAAAMQLGGGALKGIGDWQKGKSAERMADKEWERSQITELPGVESRGTPNITAPHWDRLNFPGAPSAQYGETQLQPNQAGGVSW